MRALDLCHVIPDGPMGANPEVMRRLDCGGQRSWDQCLPAHNDIGKDLSSRQKFLVNFIKAMTIVGSWLMNQVIVWLNWRSVESKIEWQGNGKVIERISPTILARLCPNAELMGPCHCRRALVSAISTLCKICCSRKFITVTDAVGLKTKIVGL